VRVLRVRVLSMCYECAYKASTKGLFAPLGQPHALSGGHRAHPLEDVADALLPHEPHTRQHTEVQHRQ
jgi:hypothetical protein